MVTNNSSGEKSRIAKVAVVYLEKEMALYDHLPEKVRKLLQEAHFDIDSHEVRQVIDMFGVDMALELYREQNEECIAEYRASFEKPAEVQRI